MKPLPFMIFFVFLIAELLKTQTIEIPLCIEKSPTGKDSFVPYHRIENPKVTLALSGGGARGLAQIGVLKVLKRHGIPIHGIAGTSMGAIIGGLYSVGYSPDELDSLSRQIAWDEIIHDTPSRQQLFLAEKTERFRHLLQFRFHGFSVHIQNAYTSGLTLNRLLSDLIWKAPYPVSSDFDEFFIPFHAVSTDLLTGNKVVISNGSLIDALRSSMGIPLLFTPVKKENAWLVDGGLVQNLPVEEARQMEGDIVIAVDTSSKLRTAEHLNAPWEVADQVTTIMAQEAIRDQYRLADVGIQPELNEISNTDFSKIDELIQAGERAAEAVIPAIDSLITRLSHDSSRVAIRINQISFTGCLATDPDQDIQNLDLNFPLDNGKIQEIARALYNSGHYTSIQSSLDTISHEIIFHVQETPIIRGIDFIGNSVFSDSLLLSVIKTHPGEMIHIHQGREDIRRLLATYHRNGYTLVHLEDIYIKDQVLVLHINEGRIRNIKIEGLRITNPFVVQREYSIFSGDLFQISKVNQTVQNIFSTGYFKETGFDVIPCEDQYRLIFHVNEHQYSLTRLGARYDLERRTKGFIEIVRDNIFGFGAEGSFFGLIGPGDLSIRLGLRADRLYTTYLTSRFEFGFNRSEYDFYQNYRQLDEYTESQIYSIMGIGFQMQRLGTISLELQSEGYRLHSSAGLSLDTDDLFLQTICIRSEVDTRDRMPFPQYGKYHRLQYEISNHFLGSDIDFIRLFSSMESYSSLHKNLVLHTHLFWGTADLSTPFSKYFYMGGIHGFMGLPERALTGKRHLLISGELRNRIRWIRKVESYLSFRFDFGGMWEKYSKINTGDFKHGYGIIVSVHSPLGPLEAAIGRMNEGNQCVYFSLGHSF